MIILKKQNMYKSWNEKKKKPNFILANEKKKKNLVNKENLYLVDLYLIYADNYIIKKYVCVCVLNFRKYR